MKTLAHRRRAIDWTQTNLAKLAGVSQSLVTKIERGRVDPTYSKVKALFDTLETLESQAFSRIRATAGEIANSDVASVGPEDSVEQAIDLMRDGFYSQVPVLDGGRVVGSFSEGDYVEALHGGRDPAAIPKERVRVLMKEPFPQVAEETSSDVLVGILHYAPAVLVVKGGNLTGIVTKTDLFKLTGGRTDR